MLRVGGANSPWRIDPILSGKIQKYAVSARVKQLCFAPQPALILGRRRKGYARGNEVFVLSINVIAFEIDRGAIASRFALM